METFLQFGAGNIGRSFIGQLFACGGFEVVFVDVDDAVIDALNERRQYRVEIADSPPGEIFVEHVRGVHAGDRDAVVREMLAARLAATAVGANALPKLIPTLAAGLVERHRRGSPPLDVILCENIHGASRLVSEALRSALPPGFPLERGVGLVETSIGKMVPLTPPELRQRDPLLVRAERYNTLIVDRNGFRQPVPEIPGIEARTNMAAYVDRKLYIHNLGHAATAYHSAYYHPAIATIDEAIRCKDTLDAVLGAMSESADALSRHYPQEFSRQLLGQHVDELIQRFQNPALGDTIYRVGRDVRRKLAREDRIIGSMLLDLDEGVKPAWTAHAAACSLHFADRISNPDPGDLDFQKSIAADGAEVVLTAVCQLSPDREPDRTARRLILDAARELT